MITLDAIRAALSAADPYAEMDRLVRGEMVAGRKVNDIFNDLNPLTDTVLDTPGMTEDGEEAYYGTLDALTGNCRSEDCYKDTPEHEMPTESEVENLPQWARLAFSARCARRFLPLLRNAWPELSVRDLDGVRYLVQLAEYGGATASAFGSDINEHLPSLNDAPNQLARQVFAITKYAHNDWIRTTVLVNRLAKITAVTDPRVATLVARDYRHLAKLSVHFRWTDDTPVPPDVFGPLWPEGPPPGWPADPDVPQCAELQVTFLALERVIPMVLEDEAVNVFNALNRYYIARTGDRLTLDGDILTLVAALVGAGG